MAGQQRARLSISFGREKWLQKISANDGVGTVWRIAERMQAAQKFLHDKPGRNRYWILPTADHYLQCDAQAQLAQVVRLTAAGEVTELCTLGNRPDGAVLVLHGVLRNADDYFRAALSAQAAAGDVGKHTLMIAPQFLIAPDVEAFKLLDGGLRDGGWMGEGRPKGGHALAILPRLQHYNLDESPLFAAVALDFLDAEQP